jgi:hypothetical protein
VAFLELPPRRWLFALFICAASIDLHIYPIMNINNRKTIIYFASPFLFFPLCYAFGFSAPFVVQVSYSLAFFPGPLVAKLVGLQRKILLNLNDLTVAGSNIFYILNTDKMVRLYGSATALYSNSSLI